VKSVDCTPRAICGGILNKELPDFKANLQKNLKKSLVAKNTHSIRNSNLVIFVEKQDEINLREYP
jgi:hypothetical protein